jgi:hypothetical protein
MCTHYRSFIIRRNCTIKRATSFGYLISGYINLARVTFSSCTMHCYNIHCTEHSSYVYSLQVFHHTTELHHQTCYLIWLPSFWLYKPCQSNFQQLHYALLQHTLYGTLIICVLTTSLSSPYYHITHRLGDAQHWHIC